MHAERGRDKADAGADHKKSYMHEITREMGIQIIAGKSRIAASFSLRRI
jgi:hypothetical protein